MDLPNVVSAARAWVALFRCQLNPVRALMPPPLEPVTMRGDRVVVAAFLIDVDDATMGRYRHMGVGFAARYRPWLTPPFGAIWLERRSDDFGYWVQFSAMSTRAAVDASIAHWGFPSFLADIDIQVKRSKMNASVAEKGVEVMRMEMNRPGSDMPMRFPFRTYGRAGDEILRTETTVDSVGREKSMFISSSLTLRRHERVEDLRGVSIELHDPVEVRWYDSFRMRMDEPSARFKVK
ncbi:MAG: acetoacetate decarboxylase family protein [Polyangiaceae bacterium]|jgi:hypothetical protein|nr:acetoacetate decarboxylase family protein [Polyangiaceae bacterium]